MLNFILEKLFAGRARVRMSESTASPRFASELPLRAELFNLDQLVRHGRAVAEGHQLGAMTGGTKLLGRLAENERILQSYNRATLIADKTRQVTPAAEWLLDNFYLIEEQIQLARRHLPRSYSRELPCLIRGLSARLPRVYDLALEFISHVDAQVDNEPLRAFLSAYQAVHPLNLGELWAVPIMLRLGLIENLRRIAARLCDDREDRDLADQWADRLQRSLETDSTGLIVVVARMAEAKLPLSSAFVTELSQRLGRMDPAAHLARTWLEQQLAGQNLTLEHCAQVESQGQAADQVSISHVIASLRFLGATDWQDFVESMSVVEQTLRNDPAGIYTKMDFATRDQYRHQVELFARGSRFSENELAWKTIELAERGAKEKGGQDRTAHVGYYLVDKGQTRLQELGNVRLPGKTLPERLIRAHALAFYFGSITLLLTGAVAAVVGYALAVGLDGWRLVLLGFLSASSLSQLAVALANWLSTLLVRPRSLPRLDFSNGIAPDAATIVVVPTLLASAEAIERLLESLEIHYLANRDKNLRFALLTDFPDAPQQSMPGDELRLRQVREGIMALNREYESDRPDIFFLFHRPRRWNAAEERWMGYERKRGKLAEFNACLRGRGRERFAEIVGDLSLLTGTKYVITLDTDTQLPHDAARRLVGAMAHLLNRPEFDPDTGTVREGYGILQPRVGVSLPSAGRSLFVKIFAGETGIDPYTRTVSDVYQDVFDEGSYIGKGIYDVDAFERALQGRFPENTILSHDLLESVHARSALITDVELYEEYPSRYNVDINRRHRWIRGDWQIAQWLLPRVPGPDARLIANPLSGLSQWKLLDNLRRSLVPIALLLLLTSGWVIAPQLGGLAVVMVLVVLLIPGLLSVLGELTAKPGEWPLTLHLRAVGHSSLRQLAQITLALAFLPYDAFVSIDAIVRTLVRVIFTHRQLLEWQTSIDAERTARSDIRGFHKSMWFAPSFAFGMLVWLAAQQPVNLGIALPFLALWAAAPAIAWRISLPIVSAGPQISDRQRAFLRRVARRTWRFFETFVNERENWLPPDNFQEHPQPVVASRTSPTNIGMALLANVTACDFGYLPVGGVLDRTEKTFATLRRLERFRGHFYNWYDTRSLKPLHPFYISMVDSGNLAGHLFVLGASLLEYADQSIVDGRIFDGLRDTFQILQEHREKSPLLERLRLSLVQSPVDLHDAHLLLRNLTHDTAEFAAQTDAQGEGGWWCRALADTCRAHLEDLLWAAPWLPSIAELIETRPLAGVRDHHSPGHNGQARSGTPLPMDHEGAARFLRQKLAALEKTPTLREAAAFRHSVLPVVEEVLAHAPKTTPPGWTESFLRTLLARLTEGCDHADERLKQLETLEAQAREFAGMDFTFLFNPERDLFAIGYNVADHRRDNSYYDLLASEARLGSFVAIAQGQVNQEHWFSLGRLLACVHGDPILISWSGSMFEYLMPLLVMPTYENTLIDSTYRTSVKAQMEYGRARGIPWGVSESCYNLTDAQSNYQYRAFGVPGLGLKRGLADDLVVAPYASVMALMVAPVEACENLERLAAEGRLGDYGFYEAVDYTPSRLPPNESSTTVRSFMVHHQGMSLLSIEFLLLDKPMQRRFLAYPPFKAEELLLQERVPKAITALSSDDLEIGEAQGLIEGREEVMRVFSMPDTPFPEVHLLSNGRYHVVISNAGGGYSRWNDLAVTRWREDSTRDHWGSFIYVREVESGEYWSIAHQPTLKLGANYEAVFTQARAEFRQRHEAVEGRMEISVSPEDDVELRRVKLTNHSSRPVTIELTTYAEVVLAPRGADAAHPAFGNLFVQTEFLETHPALLCTRRPRGEGERPPWLFHLIVPPASATGEVSYETDRARFLGRGHDPAAPAALQTRGPLSNTVGSVLDPIVSLRRSLTIAAEKTVQLEVVTGVAATREAAAALVEKYYNPRMADRLVDLAWTHSQVVLRQLDANEGDAQLYTRMAGALIYANPLRRANAGILLNNRRGQSSLWSYGISGDLPIVLLRATEIEKSDLVRRLVQAHAYWRLKGLAVDLVILNEDSSIYRQSLQDRIVGFVASSLEAHTLDKPGGIFVRRFDALPPEDRTLLQAVARLTLSDENGTLEEQIQRKAAPEPVMPRLKTVRAPLEDQPAALPARELIFPNGYGGFTPDGREYVISLLPSSTEAMKRKSSPLLKIPGWRGEFPRLLSGGLDGDDEESPAGRFILLSRPRRSEPGPSSAASGTMTPAPWVNVIANPNFGTLVTESGGGYTWFENSHEFRLTPWNNDPVGDASGEALYIRDEETGQFWSPTPLPARGGTPYVVRHGFGYTVFEHTENGIASEVWVYVAMDAPIKFTAVKLRNLSGRPRKLSVYACYELVLGDLREKSAFHVQTELDTATGAIFARSRYNTEFADYVAFVDVNDPGRTFTCNRREFFGRNGTPAKPAALRRARLSDKYGAGLDPCVAMQVVVELRDEREQEIVFRLGAGNNLSQARELLQRHRKSNANRAALESVWSDWTRALGAVVVETPDPALNLMANGWLMYQVLGCRMWGRTGFYQSGGAFGFRDQLQDAMSLVHTRPQLLREHILRAAARQFREGDVQHWWHPPSGRGVRTHFSDDYLWLPYAVCRYVQCVQDTGILDEPVPFLEGRPLRPEEESYYDMPIRSPEPGTLYQHCLRAIDYGLKFGEHGLPLMGCGDWNDGMNLVGAGGRGESVWLAFFLFDVLKKFAELARQRNDMAVVARCLTQAEMLRGNIDRHAWDGQWYLRAYFDNGEPLGSRSNPECQIDSLPQSWSVIAGFENADRSTQAMKSVEQRLVRRSAGLIQLFDPPFNSSPNNPGYIKGYVPGVRENGGQYTHAAIWAVMAFAELGQTELAWELFGMLNPVNHGGTEKQIAVYKVEPYVAAADIYAASPHTGRGGWTWYTGSAGWMYRLIIETLLGVQLEGTRLRVRPRLPKNWPSIKIHYRFRETLYQITVQRISAGPEFVRVDGQKVEEWIPLADDRREHQVQVQVSDAVRAPAPLPRELTPSPV